MPMKVEGAITITHQKPTPSMPPNLVIGTRLKPLKYIECKAWVDLGERSRRFWENVGLVLDNGIGFGQALKCSWRWAIYMFLLRSCMKSYRGLIFMYWVKCWF